MNFNHSLDLVQSQKLIMTNQLKQSLSILAMGKLELDETISKEVEENPLIEVEKVQDIDWEKYIKDMERTQIKDRNELAYNVDNEMNFENIVKKTSNIYDELKLQISLYKLTCEEMDICEYIIDCLDDNGYLNIEDNIIIENLNTDEDTYGFCLDLIQQLEPSGVGARSLEECLVIQANNLGLKDNTINSIIKNDLRLIASNRFKDIAKKYNISLQKCMNMIAIIKTLNPKPGLSCTNEKIIYVQPDVIIEEIGNNLIVYTNEKDNPKININNFYKEVLKNAESDNHAKDFIKEKLNSATGLMKNIESRKTTILKIANVIVERQEDFMRMGPRYIKPLRMKDIAEELGFHESTISRGVNDKYMLTPFGLYEFKHFFSSSLSNDECGETSSTSIKKIIKDTIKSENRKKPLSDDKLSKILKEEGINVARRTVAKYREEMGILSSSKRKEI